MRVIIVGADERDVRATIEQLCDVLIDCVEGGASVSFMRPITRGTARVFWEGVLAGVALGEGILFVARDTSDGIDGGHAHGAIVGTV